MKTRTNSASAPLVQLAVEAIERAGFVPRSFTGRGTNEIPALAFRVEGDAVLAAMRVIACAEEPRMLLKALKTSLCMEIFGDRTIVYFPHLPYNEQQPDYNLFT